MSTSGGWLSGLKKALARNRFTARLVLWLKTLTVAVSRVNARRRRVNPVRELAVACKGVSGRHVFFGYHDVTPFSHDDTRILANSLDVHGADSPAASMQVGYFEMDRDGSFIPIDSTTSWCWQMGARLQWFGPHEDRVVYNKRFRDRHVAVVFDVARHAQVDEFDRPLYALSPSAEYGVSLDFCRLQRLRPGYGYRDAEDESVGDRMPARDGLWLVDLGNHDSELLLSCADAAQWEPPENAERAEHYFNHVLWSPDSRRFLYLHLLKFDDGSRMGRAFVYDIERRRPMPLELSGYTSHFAWHSDNEILMYSRNEGSGTGLNLYDIDTGVVTAVCRDEVRRDCHPMFCPTNPDLVVLDSYPRRPLFERELFLLDIERAERTDLLSFYSPVRFSGEHRCDLHPRWDRAGRRVVVDSLHSGVRQLAVVDTQALS